MLGYIYRSVNQSLVDTEKLLKLLSEPTDINDKPGAPDLIVENGEIEFGKINNVLACFVAHLISACRKCFLCL